MRILRSKRGAFYERASRKSAKTEQDPSELPLHQIVEERSAIQTGFVGDGDARLDSRDHALLEEISKGGFVIFGPVDSVDPDPGAPRPPVPATKKPARPGS